MKTVGEVLKEARIDKKYSKEKLEDITKIKSSFIEAIEKENWSILPDYSTVQGFVRTIAKTLEIKEENAIALLRRDYPPKEVSINPKPDVSGKFTWNPKKTFVAGTIILSFLIFGYLFLQYKSFVKPPKLEVVKPAEEEVVNELTLEVVGTTSTDAIIMVNNQPAIVGADGNFSVELEISEDTEEIEIKAVSRSGKETVIHRSIKIER